MKRAEAVSLNSEGAIGSRSLPLSFLAGALLCLALVPASFAAPSSGVMQRWRGYALSKITPDFAWAERPAAPAPTVLDRSEPGSVRLSLAVGGDHTQTLNVHIRSMFGGAALHRLDADDGTTPLLRQHASPLTGTLAQTGFGGQFGGHGRYGLSVVLAHQRFAAPGMDGISFAATTTDSGARALAGSSHGAGVEFMLADRLTPHLNWYAGARTRISMDAFQNYRGIYGNPGDMDLPATMRAGLEWLPRSATRVRFGVDRIQYSEIEPFVSTALPRRLLAVLGDGTSPVFSWRDLDMYSVTLLQDVGTASHWSLRYSTRQQPLPTSPLLAKLLREQAADYALGVGFSHQAGLGEWRFDANYAPAELVLGIPTSAKVNHPFDGRQFEFQVLWTMPF